MNVLSTSYHFSDDEHSVTIDVDEKSWQTSARHIGLSLEGCGVSEAVHMNRHILMLQSSTENIKETLKLALKSIEELEQERNA